MRGFARFSSVWLLLICVWLASSAFAQTAPVEIDISDQQTRRFNLPAANFTNVFGFTLPAGTTRFKVTLTGTIAAPAADADVDMFLRFARPFPRLSNDYGAPPTSDELFEYAHYQSISAELGESIIVSNAGRYPAQAGKWYLSLLNFSSTAAVSATIKLEILNGVISAAPIVVRFDLPCPAGVASCKCDLAPWNDPRTAGFSAPGNTGQTLGEKRRNAVLEAASQLSQRLRSEAPITVQACWDDLGSGDRVTLAQAGPTNFLIDDRSNGGTSNGVYFPARPASFLPQRNSFYAAATATKNNGAAACQTFGGPCNATPDIYIAFNSLIDGPEALGVRSFYYGTSTTGNAANDPDFVSVALHELTHGMGYVSLVNLDSTDGVLGEEPAGRDDIFTRQVVDLSTGTPRPLARLNNADRIAAITAGRLQWVGARALANPEFTLATGELGIPLNSPTPLESGSSLSHLDPNRFSNQLMLPFISRTRALGIAAGQLEDIGWDSTPKSTPVRPQFYAGNWFDPTRSGHGFDIEPAGSIGGFNRILFTAYTYDAAGDPEYFLAQGPVVDGVFIPEATPARNSLVRYRYVNNRPTIDNSVQGYVRVDFNDAGASKSCTENGRSVPGLGAGNSGVNAGSLTFVSANQAVNWCIQQLIGQSRRPASDFTGHWYKSGDSGWGIGIAQAIDTGKNITLAVLYYPDALGNPRWAFAQSNDYQSGQTIPIKHRRGFCRTCPSGTQEIDAGSMTLTLDNVQGLRGQINKVSFDVEFKGAAGGRFTRTDAAIERLVPRPAVID